MVLFSKLSMSSVLILSSFMVEASAVVVTKSHTLTSVVEDTPARSTSAVPRPDFQRHSMDMNSSITIGMDTPADMPSGMVTATGMPSAVFTSAVYRTTGKAMSNPSPPKMSESGNTMTATASPPSTSAGAGNETSGDDFALKTKEKWYWNKDGTQKKLAKLDCDMTLDSNGRVLALERLMDKISYVTCSDDFMGIKWKDDDSFTKAMKSLSWVNEDVAHHISIINQFPSCAGGDRMPYKVTSVESDGQLKTKLSAHQISWRDAFPQMKLKISTRGIEDANSLEKRVDFDHTFDFTNDFSGKNIINTNLGSTSLQLDCTTCKAAGTLDVEVDVSLSITGGLSGSVTLTPNGVAATFGVDALTGGEIDAFNRTFAPVQFPLPGAFKIPEVADVGPNLFVGIDVKLSVSGSVQVNLGTTTLHLSDGSSATFQIDGTDLDASGFDSSFTNVPPKLGGGSVSANAEVGPDFALGLEAEILGHGVAFGLSLIAPRLDASLTLSGANCDNSVSFDAGVAAQLNAFAGAGKIPDVVAQNTLKLASTSTQLFSTCFPAPSPGVAACQAKFGAFSTTPKQCSSIDVTSNDQKCPAPNANLCCQAGQVCGSNKINGANQLCCA